MTNYELMPRAELIEELRAWENKFDQKIKVKEALIYKEQNDYNNRRFFELNENYELSLDKKFSTHLRDFLEWNETEELNVMGNKPKDWSFVHYITDFKQIFTKTPRGYDILSEEGKKIVKGLLNFIEDREEGSFNETK